MATALEACEVRVDDERDPVELYRVESFLSLGFTLPQAEKMATTRDLHGVFLWHGDVKRLLDQGCSHHTAFDLLT